MHDPLASLEHRCDNPCVITAELDEAMDSQRSAKRASVIRKTICAHTHTCLYIRVFVCLSVCFVPLALDRAIYCCVWMGGTQSWSERGSSCSKPCHPTPAFVIYTLLWHLPNAHGKQRGPGELSRYSDSLQAGRSGDRIPVGARFSTPVQTGPGAYPASYSMGTGCLFWG
jgi:hypothetical protein